MDQARNYICKQCATPVPSGHKFCGRCGASVPVEIVELQVRFFGAMQAPGKARLILIRGDAGVDGLSYLLQGAEHVAGSKDGQILFPDDAWLSPRHANFLYRGESLVVRDEGSANGVYVRVRGQAQIAAGAQAARASPIVAIEVVRKKARLVMGFCVAMEFSFVHGRIGIFKFSLCWKSWELPTGGIQNNDSFIVAAMIYSVW